MAKNNKNRNKRGTPNSTAPQAGFKASVIPVERTIKDIQGAGIESVITFDLDLADKFKKSLPTDEHSDLRDWLDNFVSLGKEMLSKYAEATKHLKDKDEFKKEKEHFSSKFEKLSELEATLPERERKIEEKELNARMKFSKQNEESVLELKHKIKNDEIKLSELKNNIQKSEKLLSDVHQEQEAKLNEKEFELLSKENKLNKDKIRINQGWKDVDEERNELKAEIEKGMESEREILQIRIKKAEIRAERAFKESDELREKMDDFKEFERILKGKSAKQLLKEHQKLIKEKQGLEYRLTESDTSSLERDNEGLKEKIHNLETRLKEVEPELIKKEAELSRQRLGILDKQNLTEEKKALEKHKQILTAHLNDLETRIDQLTESQQAQSAFPALTEMDKLNNKSHLEDIPDLKDFAPDLRRRIAYAEEGVVLNYRLEDIQLLLGGLAMSQLHVFQGISGTGKTSLAKAFAKAMGGYCTDIAIQAGWRDRDDLLGHYNAFEKRFYEKDCLQGLYRAQTPQYEDRCNIILLDEMNLSRPEHYFAEFLSALEKNDPSERLISLAESKLANAPKLLIGGRQIKVPENIWFIGTANHDETTNELADKTYDRSHIMVLPKHETGEKIERIEPQAFSYASLQKEFKKAQEKNKSNVEELLQDLTTSNLSVELENIFDFGWGNRFERQALQFIPVVMASGGTQEMALDHLLATRVFRQGKITGRYDATIEDIQIIKKALETLSEKWTVKPIKSLKLLERDVQRKNKGL